MIRRVSRLLAPLWLAAASHGAGGSVWLDVPFVRQEKNGCGAASIAMVMEYWRGQHARVESVPAAEIHRTLYSQRARGVYASDLERYLRQQGFRTFAFRGEWSDLRRHLEKGRPLIVALHAGDRHYAVITGIDWEREIVLQHDPARRQLLQQHRSVFEKGWKAAGNWALLAVPGDSPSR